MTTPYRIVWHTGNPWNGEWLPRPGEKCDMITVQRLALQDPASIPDDRPTHVIYVNYGVWYAEITCKFSASRDQLGQFRLRTCNPTLRGAIGSPEEIYFAMFEEVATPVPAHSPEEREAIIKSLTENDAIAIRLTEKDKNIVDDNGFSFIEFIVLCQNQGYGTHEVRVIGKRLDLEVSGGVPGNEMLSDPERRRLEIGDHEWHMYYTQAIADNAVDGEMEMTDQF